VYCWGYCCINVLQGVLLLECTAGCIAGKRTVGGLIDDGVKSLVRYYLNNFQV
jgi:hypothetical protein